MPILDTHGLLGGESIKVRLSLFAVMLFISASMVFTQFGYVKVGEDLHYGAYVMALLGPIACVAILAGVFWGMLEGILAGAVLYVHAHMFPLDIVEYYMVTARSTIVLYGMAGLLLGMLFSIALRKNPQGRRRTFYLAVVCAVVALLSTRAFVDLGLYRMAERENIEFVLPLMGQGYAEAQIVCDFCIMLVVCMACDWLAAWFTTVRSYVSVRTLFRTRLIATLSLAFVAASVIAYIAITVQATRAAHDNIVGNLNYLERQFVRLRDAQIKSSPKSQRSDSPEDMLADLQSEVIDGYDLSDGTILGVLDGKIVYSYNPDYHVGQSIEDSFGSGAERMVAAIADTFRIRVVVYRDGTRGVQLGVLMSSRPLGAKNGYVVYAMPFSMVYAHRSETLLWVTLIVFLLLVIVYILANRLLRRLVVDPISETNKSLAKITGGDLDVMVCETDCVEFTMLSTGINITVDALKGFIAEAERRNEQDLATARAIQEGALPQAFPAFPRVESVNLFASMNAAKMVGGDFYDFFELDDHVVGFLIADVSGKGIPGALFMMAAKNEIENRMLSGMGLAESIKAANTHLCSNNEAGMFVTVWAATLDWETGELTYVNAGHNFPLLRHGQGGTWEWLKKKCGLFLGTFEMAKYREENLMLQPGDELILYTDGVNEAFSVDEEEYGNDRLDAFLAEHNDLRPKELVQALRADVGAWAEGAEQSDDVTILVMEYGVTSGA
ncbi:MAG: SpoIIE family protein phosphatase [Atopobiaceae bacterium]|nr:SpoIIE family protein phosphatase [Atopobiaceae bacterium]